MLAEKLKGKRVVLASKSPRRQELLKGLNLEFEVKTKEVDESYPIEIEVDKIAEYLALKKAIAFGDELDNNTILITADTIVIKKNEVLEKPNNKGEAKKILTELSGNSHKVITGVCVKTIKKTISFSVSTTVHFKVLTSLEIDYYINHFKPFDKAGSYGIQEWIGYIGIPKIEGSYFNVMGLPVFELNEVLNSL